MGFLRRECKTHLVLVCLVGRRRDIFIEFIDAAAALLARASVAQNVKRATTVPCRDAGVDGAEAVLMNPNPDAVFVVT